MNAWPLTRWVRVGFFISLLQSVSIRDYPWFVFLLRVSHVQRPPRRSAAAAPPGPRSMTAESPLAERSSPEPVAAVCDRHANHSTFPRW